MTEKIIKNLEEIRQELWADRFNKETIENYNIIIDYINTLEPYYYNLLTNTMKELIEVIFPKDLPSLLKEEATSISRLKNYINTTVEDDIYQLDGYANLSNITTDDFDTLLLDLISIVEED